MKKTLFILMLILSLSFILSSCSGDGEEVPEGLQVIEINKEHGFKFYGPEGWIITNSKVDADKVIWGAKMSSVNNISINLVKSEMPGTDIKSYFEESISEFPESFEVTVVSEPSLSNFGNAKEAYKCIYTYKYKGKDLTCMQYYIKNDGDFYIFQYTSYGDVNSEESDFSVYYDKIELSVNNFIFTEKGEKPEDTSPDNTLDSDGYKLVSDPDLTGFELYLPESAVIIESSGYVNARLSENANIMLVKSQKTGVGIVDYLKTRKSELEGLFGEVTDIKIELAVKPEASEEAVNEMFSDFDVTAVVNENTVFGDLKKGGLILYEYSYKYNREVYRVLQILGVDSFNGYVFTYTAKESDYSANLDTVTKILEKVKF